jgi:hypothetical protein
LPPAELEHFAKTVGHYSRRNKWGTDAQMFVVTCGPNSESHDSHDQGSMWVYAGGQIILGSQNMWTHSGIRQNAIYQNGIVFQSGETFLNWVRDKTEPVIVRESDGTLVMDLTICIPTILRAAGATWKRTIRTLGNLQTVTDDVTYPSSAKAFRVLNTPILPVIENGNTILGPVTITGSAEIIDWKASPPPVAGDYHKAGYGMRIPLEQGSTTFTITYPGSFAAANEEEDPMVIAQLEKDLAAALATVEALKTEDAAQLQQIATLESDLQELGGVITAKNATIVDLERQVAEGGNLLVLPLSGGYDPAKVVALDEDREIVVVSR